ncbi:nuclear transport factor 2 family protein [Nocardia yamanashiensis]|uniref:nuclear transport factor 2 family protein n=1 Tax=Nocardia yamanashiensis TaxID=209247 RepID=UPI000834624F|nr:nuclear transport factor 2 family protein [Nocardia yamanashiensis]
MSTTLEITRQLQELVDRSEIADLVDRLGRALDEGRFDELGALYTPDATAKTPGGFAPDRAALVAQAARNHSPDRHIQHFITNTIVDLDGDTATVRANLMAVFAPAATDPARPTPNPEYTLGEVYRFDARRTPEGWRLTRVETSSVWESGTRPR